MPTWLIIQLGLLLVWTVLAFFYYISKGWKTGFPFKKEQVFQFLFLRLVPIIWLVTSFIFGVIFILMNTNRVSDIAQIFSMIIVPVISLTIMGIDIWKRDRAADKLEQTERKSIREKSELCVEWANQFQFLSKENVDVKVYISNGRPVGKLTIFNVTEKQKQELQEKRELLPSGVYLEVIPVSNNDNIFH